jgi:hypothetical protein
MANKKNSVRTSKEVASKASDVLKRKAISKIVKQVAGAALVNRKKTSKK